MKRLFQIAAILLALLVAAIGGLALFFDANQFRPLLETELTKALGRQVKVGDLKLAILKGSVTASDLAIADDPRFSQTPFVRAHSLQVGVELRPLIFDRKINVTGITLDQPEIDLLQSGPGVWNFATIGSKDAAPAPATPPDAGKRKLDFSVKLIKITGGRVTIGTLKGPGKPQVFEKVEISVRDFSPTTAIPFSLTTDTRGAHIKLDGKVGPLAEKDAALTPVEAAIAITNLDLSDSGYVAKSTGIDGLVSIDGTVSSSGVAVVSKGHIKAERLKLAKEGVPAKRTVEFEFTVGHNVRKQTGILSAGAIHIGKAQATITGDYSLAEETPAINLNLNGPKMAVSELVEMLPPLGVVLPAGSSLQGGTAAAKLSIEGPLDRLVISGPLGLSDTKLAGFDLGSKLKTVASLAGLKVSPDTDIKTLSAHVHNSVAGTEVTDLDFDAPTLGELTGAGSVGPKHELDFKMRVKLHTSGGVMAVVGAKGDTTIPFSIKGTSSNPSFVPDVKGMVSEKAQSLLKSSGAGSLLNGLFGKKKQ